jgi:uncharacterized LabA/DUF88 family protein
MTGNRPKGNFAFIDGINLHLTYESKDLDWDIDYGKLYEYLEKRHNVTTAYYFLGFIERNQRIYDDLTANGYELKYREVSEFPTKPVLCQHCKSIVKGDGITTKCDCDADIVLQIMDDIEEYDKAILITSDGDFDNVVRKLLQVNKLKLVLAPCKKGCSKLLKRASKGRIDFLDGHRDKLEKIEEEP